MLYIKMKKIFQAFKQCIGLYFLKYWLTLRGFYSNRFSKRVKIWKWPWPKVLDLDLGQQNQYHIWLFHAHKCGKTYFICCSIMIRFWTTWILKFCKFAKSWWVCRKDWLMTPNSYSSQMSIIHHRKAEIQGFQKRYGSLCPF